jgi:hypothetical protein
MNPLLSRVCHRLNSPDLLHQVEGRARAIKAGNSWEAKQR